MLQFYKITTKHFFYEMISKYSLKKNQEQNITERNKLQLKLYPIKKTKYKNKL